MCASYVLAGHAGLCAVSVNPYAKMVLGLLSTFLLKKKKKKSPVEAIVVASAKVLRAWLAN